MNIHKSQLFCGSPGVPGFWPIPIKKQWPFGASKSPIFSRAVRAIRGWGAVEEQKLREISLEYKEVATVAREALELASGKLT